MNIKNIQILTFLTVYLIFISIALLSYKDYGTSIDEWDLRVHGFVNLKYILVNIFNFTSFGNSLKSPLLKKHEKS